MESTPLTWPCWGPITEEMDWATQANIELEGWATRAPPPIPLEDAAGRARDGVDPPDDGGDDDDAFVGVALLPVPISQSVQEEFCSAAAAARRCRRRSVRASCFRYSSRCSSAASSASFAIWAARKSSPPEATEGDVGDASSGAEPPLSNSATTWATAAALLCSNALAAELIMSWKSWFVKFVYVQGTFSRWYTYQLLVREILLSIELWTYVWRCEFSFDRNLSTSAVNYRRAFLPLPFSVRCHAPAHINIFLAQRRIWSLFFPPDLAIIQYLARAQAKSFNTVGFSSSFLFFNYSWYKYRYKLYMCFFSQLVPPSNIFRFIASWHLVATM